MQTIKRKIVGKVKPGEVRITSTVKTVKTIALKMEIFEDEFNENTKRFINSVKNSNWALTASERDIDSLFECALKLEQMLPQEDMGRLKDLLFNNLPHHNLNKPLDVLIESLIKNHYLNEHLTLYGISKYTLLYSKDHFSQLLEKLVSEVELRKHLHMLVEDCPDVDLDLFRLNKFICDIVNSSDSKLKIQNALNSQTLVLLKAIKHSDFLSGQFLMDETILCLESQTDLKLWFMIMKDENLEIVLDLCDKFVDFLKAIFKFFDKFADEIESNYDEELNVQYSHINLDFESFVNVFQVFLQKQSIKKKTYEYLDSKSITDKNYCFWIDVKSCL